MTRLLISAGLVLVTAAAGASAQRDACRGTVQVVMAEHPAIQYAERPTSDPVARVMRRTGDRAVSLDHDQRMGYLASVLRALDVPIASQLLVFSKTGIQRGLTGPQHPRALFFNRSVVVGYIPGAPALEIAAHDPQQGVVFYTLDQTASTGAFTRQTTCLTCHVSASTLEVPGLIARSNMVGGDGTVMPELGAHVVNHATPHTERWGGWFVTGSTTPLPYGPLGHLGNVTVTEHPTAGPAIISDRVLIDWQNSAPESRGYPMASSDIAALLVFDHQMHAMNLMTRLNWEARISGLLRDRIDELSDYLLFVGEQPPITEITPRPGFAEGLAKGIPVDRRGRSLAQLDLKTRLMKHPCSYMIYADVFDGLPPTIKDAVYRRMFAILKGKVRGTRYSHLSRADRRAITEILRETKKDLPGDVR